MIRTRTRTVLALGYQRDESDAERARIIEEFVRALSDLPAWAVSQGFDAWVRTQSFRPAPAHIRDLATKAMRPFTDEIRRREVGTRAPPPPDEPRTRVDKEAAARILASAGYTPKRLDALTNAPRDTTTLDKDAAAQPSERVTHWTDRAPAESPQIQTLQQSRNDNPLIKAAREDGKRTQEVPE